MRSWIRNGTPTSRPATTTTTRSSWPSSGTPPPRSARSRAEAGRRLLAGETLPFKPSPANVARAQEEVALNAFFAAGYDYDDAVTLAKIWKKSDPFQVKILAGKRLLAGHKLPIKPGPPDTGSGSGGVDPKEEAQVQAFFAAGYTYDDAVKLAKIWKTSDPYQAKVLGGKKLLAGATLPIRP